MKHQNFQAKWIAAGLAVLLFGNLLQFQAHCRGISKAVLRLHVIAHSDREEDQRVKLLVRDRILTEGAALFDGSLHVERAIEQLTPQLSRLEAAAHAVLQEQGLDLPVQITVGGELFNTRVYEEEGITLPAGFYMSVQVRIGAAVGKNWWCIMFPPLCLPAARAQRVSLDALLTQGQVRVIQSNPRLDPRFKIVELWYKLFPPKNKL